MPDPNWSFEYNFSNGSLNNGFTRTDYGTPVVDEITSGNPSNRRIEINSDNGDAVYRTTDIPSFDTSNGATGEFDVSCFGTGICGFEITFLDQVILAQVYQSKISIYSPNGDNATGEFEIEVDTPDNTVVTKFRIVVTNSGQVSFYREGVLVAGPQQLPTVTKPFQRFLFWGEGGGTQTLNGVRFYIGGGVIPG